MNYRIALAPELQVNATEFVATWNTNPSSQAVALAYLPHKEGKQFDIGMTEIALTIVSGLAMNLAADALYDLIKSVLLRQRVRKQTNIVEIKQPDGTRLLVVTIDEE